MTILLLAVFGALALIAGVAVGARQLEAQAWRRRLVGFQLRIPTGLTSSEVAALLASLAALTHAPRASLLVSPPVVFEATSTSNGVDYRLLVPGELASAVLSSIGASLPGIRVERLETPERDPVHSSRHRMAAGLRLAGRHRQLAVERADLSSRTITAAMQPLRSGERVTWQWIITGAGTPAPISSKDATATSLPWWLEEQAPADADGVRAARLKQRLPLMNATARLLVEGPERRRVLTIFGRAWGGLRLLNVPGSRLVADYPTPRLASWQLERRWLPSLGWPLRLNALELAGLMPWPTGLAPLPGQPAPVARQVPPPANLSRTGTVLADSTYPGAVRPLRLAKADRLMHVALLGPTGTGKSTLMVNMALQDVLAGDGLALLDPKADMAADLLDRIPERRWDDVIVLNPADTARPVGFNPLAADSEHGRELAVDHVLHVFRVIWAAFWGPRSEAVLRTSLLTLTHSRAADGSAFTLCELPRLLTDDAFRAWLTSNPNLPSSVREFWDWFNGIKPGERTQVVGPIMNKLTALTQRTPLRLILGQSDGLDLGEIILGRKILVLPLSRGLVGAETAALLSSLMVASLWQAILRRVSTASSGRHPFWLYIDEASEVVRLPVDLADVMAEARGLGAGLTLATQHLSQLPVDVRRALLATVRSQVIFQVESDDARLLARSFEPTMTADDLRTLPAHEVAMRLSIAGQTSRPLTGMTRPLPEALGSGDRLRAASRARYGRDRREVEAAMVRRATPPAQPDRPVGQRLVRGDAS